MANGDLTKNKETYSPIETGLKDHKEYKKKLTPPLAQIPKMQHSSWVNDRLPEMLWAVLIIGNIEREDALNFFHYVGKFASEKNEFSDVTLSGLSNLSVDQLKDFIQHLLKYSDKIKDTLSPLLLYPELPSFDIWQELLNQPAPDEGWNKVVNGVSKTLDHQSQEVTDCRWIKVLCLILGGKLKLSSKDYAKRILEYPNFGDQREVRPSIRAMEIGMETASNNQDTKWSNDFWKQSYESTDCIPEELFGEKTKKIQEELSRTIEDQKKHYLTEIQRVRNDLISHFCQDTNVNPRRENSFGIALYGLSLFSEIIIYNASSSLTGRIALRSLVENYINFKYLLKKEKEEPKIWDDFHSYGTGQIKLIYLKLKELSAQVKYAEIEELSRIVNEDLWIEFIPINLGHWENSDLRKMSEYACVKDIYDTYYNYTSGFVHGTRGALRTSIYQRCLNPLHRFHRIPIFDFPMMPNIIEDSIKIVNKILECLSESNPSIEGRIKLFSESKL